MIGKSILSLETKLTRLEMANDKLMDAYKEENNSEASTEFQFFDSEFMDNVIDKVPQLKVLKEEIERKRREMDTSHTSVSHRYKNRCPYYNPVKHVQINFIFSLH